MNVKKKLLSPRPALHTHTYTQISRLSRSHARWAAIRTRTQTRTETPLKRGNQLKKQWKTAFNWGWEMCSAVQKTPAATRTATPRLRRVDDEQQQRQCKLTQLLLLLLLRKKEEKLQQSQANVLQLPPPSPPQSQQPQRVAAAATTKVTTTTETLAAATGSISRSRSRCHSAASFSLAIFRFRRLCLLSWSSWLRCLRLNSFPHLITVSLTFTNEYNITTTTATAINNIINWLTTKTKGETKAKQPLTSRHTHTHTRERLLREWESAAV